jgi:hypothetical protein
MVKSPLELFDHTLSAGQRTGKRRADLQHELPHWPAVEHHVVRDDILDICGRAADDRGHVSRRIGGDVPLLLLCEIQRVENGGLPMLGCKLLRKLLELRSPLGRELELGTFGQRLPLRSMPLLRAVRHWGMKAHRSTSPITTSSEPMTAMTSAIIPPTMNLWSAWHAIRLGARIFTRQGRLVPSDTT